jgi:hypothetical protein
MIQQTPWIERKFDFNFPASNYPVILARLTGAVPRIASIISRADPGLLSIQREGKWSVLQLIGHLGDLEDLWDQRITDFLEGKETLTAADMTNTRTNEAHHENADPRQLLERFERKRNALLERVRVFDITQVSMVAIHPRLKQSIRLVDSLFFVAEHDDHEIAKMIWLEEG